MSLLVFCEKALAGAIEIKSAITGLAIGTWSGSGNVDFDSNLFCVESYTGDCNTQFAEKYTVTASNNVLGSLVGFRLLNADRTKSLPITMVYTDLVGIPETLVLGQPSAMKTVGSACDNAKITVIIAEDALLAVPSGSYAETMNIFFEQAEYGSDTYQTFVNVSISVPDLVRISSLNDINLGSWSGAGNWSNSDAVCVYKNSTGTYAITFTGDGGRVPGTAFRLTNNSKSNDLAYQVAYNDYTGNVTVAPGTKLTGRTGHNQISATCGGGTNATVTVTILESIMASAPSDSYHGTLTMLVSPQ